MAGAFGFFMCFGDDLLLFSFFWVSHLVLLAAAGLGTALRRWPRASPFLRVGAGAFLALHAVNQAVFLVRVLRHYTDRLFTL